MNIITGEIKGLAEKAGAALTALLKKHHRSDVLLLLAGGSCTAALEYVPEEVLSPYLTIAPLDDRFSTNPKINNLMQLKTTNFYQRCLDADVNVADMVPSEEDSKEDLAMRYEEVLREWVAENPKGIVLGLFGVGEDGHIGSVMPFPEDPKRFEWLFLAPDTSVVAYDAGSKNEYPLRMTTTLSFMKEYVSGGVVYVTGKKKHDALEKINATEGVLAETPARILRVLPDITVFTDQKI